MEIIIKILILFFTILFIIYLERKVVKIKEYFSCSKNEDLGLETDENGKVNDLYKNEKKDCYDKIYKEVIKEKKKIKREKSKINEMKKKSVDKNSSLLGKLVDANTDMIQEVKEAEKERKKNKDKK